MVPGTQALMLALGIVPCYQVTGMSQCDCGTLFPSLAPRPLPPVPQGLSAPRPPCVQSHGTGLRGSILKEGRAWTHMLNSKKRDWEEWEDAERQSGLSGELGWLKDKNGGEKSYSFSGEN